MNMRNKEHDQEEDPHALTLESRTIWDQLATWWNEEVGEGNQFHQQIIWPTTEDLLGLKEGEHVLDIACGNGNFARRLAQRGAYVVACDVSEQFLHHAQEQTHAYQDRIEYRQIDATDEQQLLTLGLRRFDAAVCTMSLMDLSTLDPLASALHSLLKTGGRFIFSITHPCFNSSHCQKVIEEVERDDRQPAPQYAIKVTRYIRPSARKYIGMMGQPLPHYTFDRPLSLLFAPFFRAGFLLDRLEEPVFDQQTAQARWVLSSVNFTDFPPGLFARFRLLPEHLYENFGIGMAQ